MYLEKMLGDHEDRLNALESKVDAQRELLRQHKYMALKEVPDKVDKVEPTPKQEEEPESFPCFACNTNHDSKHKAVSCCSMTKDRRKGERRGKDRRNYDNDYRGELKRLLPRPRRSGKDRRNEKPGMSRERVATALCNAGCHKDHLPFSQNIEWRLKLADALIKDLGL